MHAPQCQHVPSNAQLRRLTGKASPPNVTSSGRPVAASSKMNRELCADYCVTPRPAESPCANAVPHSTRVTTGARQGTRDGHMLLPLHGGETVRGDRQAEKLTGRRQAAEMDWLF